jgi:hypothetical protein
MSESISLVLYATAIGIGATAFMDVWTALQGRLFNVASLDYAMVGRWLGHLPRRFAHASISAAPPVAGEAVIGWAAHYAIGVLFAGVLLAIWGLDWARNPSLPPALMVGLSTVVAPFLILQPALGAGIAASRTPSPNIARARSLVTHFSFGLGLYLAAEAVSRLDLV